MSYQFVWFLLVVLTCSGPLVAGVVQLAGVLRTPEPGLGFVRAVLAIVAIVLGGIILAGMLGRIHPGPLRAEFLQQTRPQP